MRAQFNITKHEDRRGFTLVEILIVLALATMILGVVMTSVQRRSEKAKKSSAKLQLQMLKSEVSEYSVENGQVPTREAGLAALGTTIPKDPWGQDYIYLVPGRGGESFEIISYGSDGEPGGEGNAADLSSSTP